MAASDQQQMNPYQVLIVDDDTQMRKLLKRVVADTGCVPVEIPKAKDALALIEKGQAHAMLLDLQMPGASGMDLLRVLRRRRLEIPTIVVSGFISEEAAVQLAELRAQAIVAKPFALDRLTSELRKALGLPDAGATPP